MYVSIKDCYKNCVTGRNQTLYFQWVIRLLRFWFLSFNCLFVLLLVSMTSSILVCKEISSTFSCCVILNISSFQIEYDAHYTQLNFLKTLSNYANQNVTYACRKSKAWEDGQHSIKLMGSNEMQYHATSKISLRPNVITNECTVSWQFACSLVRNKPPFTIHSLGQHCYRYNLGIHFYAPTDQ